MFGFVLVARLHGVLPWRGRKGGGTKRGGSTNGFPPRALPGLVRLPQGDVTEALPPRTRTRPRPPPSHAPEQPDDITAVVHRLH